MQGATRLPLRFVSQILAGIGDGYRQTAGGGLVVAAPYADDQGVGVQLAVSDDIAPAFLVETARGLMRQALARHGAADCASCAELFRRVESCVALLEMPAAEEHLH